MARKGHSHHRAWPCRIHAKSSLLGTEEARGFRLMDSWRSEGDDESLQNPPKPRVPRTRVASSYRRNGRWPSPRCCFFSRPWRRQVHLQWGSSPHMAYSPILSHLQTAICSRRTRISRQILPVTEIGSARAGNGREQFYHRNVQTLVDTDFRCDIVDQGLHNRDMESIGIPGAS